MFGGMARGAARALLLAAALLFALPGAAQEAAFLPSEVKRLVKQSRIELADIGLHIQRADGAVLAAHNANRQFAPASAIKIATAMAALDLLGADYAWETRFASNGTIENGTLKGDLYLIGGGDPYITVDNFLYMLSRLRGLGIDAIAGDLIIDDGIFLSPPHDPAAFDGRSHQPYNVDAAGMAVNFKTQQIIITPQGGRIHAFAHPPNDNFVLQNRLKKRGGACGNWRQRLAQNLTGDEQRVTLVLSGAYSAACGERSFYFSALSHAAYAAGAFGGLWRQLGGEWDGNWRRGAAPDGLADLYVHSSRQLPDVLRAMNKYSNNQMARAVFLSLAQADGAPPPYSLARAQNVMQAWLRRQGVTGVRIENGSGLSRRSAIAPAQLTRLLQILHRHRYRPELASSLPILGVDGTLKKRMAGSDAEGWAHLKTGSLRDVVTISGFVRGRGGADVLFTLFVRGKGAGRAVALQDALIAWARGQ